MSSLATALRLSRAALAGAWLLAMIGSGPAHAQAAGHAEENSSSATASSRDLTSLFRALEAERQDAFARGDRAVLERHFAQEYVHTNLRGGTTTREEELAFFGPGSFTLESGTISEITVRDYGSTAVLHGLVDWRGAQLKVGGNTVDLSGRFRVTRTYVWRDGRWQVAASHASRVGG